MCRHCASTLLGNNIDSPRPGSICRDIHDKALTRVYYELLFPNAIRGFSAEAMEIFNVKLSISNLTTPCVS